MTRPMATATGAVLFAVLGVALDVPAVPATTGSDTAASGGVDEMEARTLARFQARDDEPVRSFRGRRRMRAEGLGRWAALDVLVELDAESGFRWTVEAESGSKLIRDRAFRGLLEEEAAARGTAGPDGGAITAENYDLSTDGREKGGLVRLRAVPRRRDRRLLDGIVVVTANDADLVRVEGRLARNPSFWVTRVDVVRRFRRLNGHRVVVRAESVAHVRLLGDVRVTIDFDYETIDGDSIEPGRDAGDSSSIATIDDRLHHPRGSEPHADRRSRCAAPALRPSPATDLCRTEVPASEVGAHRPWR